jgi:PAS domain S-box-containing protein
VNILQKNIPGLSTLSVGLGVTLVAYILYWQYWPVLFAGGIISLSLATNVFMFTSREKRSVQQGVDRPGVVAKQFSTSSGWGEDRFHSVVNTIVDGIVIIDGRGVIEYFNPKAEEIFGYRSDEIVGRNVSCLMPEPHRGAHDSYLGNYQRSGEAKIIGVGREVEGLRKDGTLFALDLAVSELNSGGEVKYTGVIRDMTERKKLEDDLRSHAVIVDQMSEAVLMVDLDGVVLDCNRATMEMLGYTKDDLIGKPATILHDDSVAGTSRRKIQVALDLEGRFFGEVNTRCKDGSVKICELSVQPMYNHAGEVIGNIGINRDVTDRKAAETELVVSRISAENANYAKSQFLSSMSHELRTPLNSVIGFARHLMDDDDQPLSVDQEDSVSRIFGAGTHLLDLISQVLDLSKIESGNFEVHLANVDLATVLDASLGLVVDEAIKAGIEINVQQVSGLSVRADPVRLNQIIFNLLSNAIKYNRENGKVEVAVFENDRGRITVSVSDTGQGVAGERLAELFQPFNRLGAESSAIEGTGVGLVIARKLLELMDGTISVESIEGEGSTFSFELAKGNVIPECNDIRKTPDETTGAAGLPSVNEIGCTILYVEDNPANRVLMSKVIARKPEYNLIMAANAEDALEITCADPPDVILMDINLPGINGLEALERINDNSETAKIPVIALTAKAMQKDVERGRDAGFYAYLTKPINFDEVWDAISRATGT